MSRSVGGKGSDPILVLEVGGTNLRGGWFDPHRAELHGIVRRAMPRRPDGSAVSVDDTLAAIEAVAREVSAGLPPAAVSVAYPGPVDHRGVALATPTVTGSVEPLDVGGHLRRWFPGTTVTVVNDLTAAGHRIVADGGPPDFCVLTVGSGIGHKVFVGGTPLVGPGARGGELGHLRVDPAPDALPCDCGERGHLGGIASGRGALALVRRAAAADPDGPPTLRADVVDNRAIVDAHQQADPWLDAVLAPAIDHLATALAAVHLAVGTEHFVLVGGFARAMGERYRARLAAAASESCWSLGQDWDAMIRLGAPDDDHGLLGAGHAATP